MLTRFLTFFLNLYCAGLAIYLVLRLVVGDAFWWLALLNTFAPYLFLPLVVILLLALILRVKRTGLWTLVLSLIGIAWFIMPVMMPKTPVTPSGLTLKVVTFNILGVPRDLTDEILWLLRSKADVIVLEEVIAEGIDPRLLPLRVVYPHEAVVKGSLRIFSRYPYSEAEIIVLEEHPGRLGLRVVLDVDGQPVTVYGVHFTLPVRSTPHIRLPFYRFPFSFALHYDETRRNAQIRRLLDIVATEPHPYIVAGDFNTSAYSVIYGKIAGVMVDSFAAAGQGFGHTWAVSRVVRLPETVPPLLRIDYIWHSRDWETVSSVTGPALNSDHLSVMSVLALKDSSEFRVLSSE